MSLKKVKPMFSIVIGYPRDTSSAKCNYGSYTFGRITVTWPLLKIKKEKECLENILQHFFSAEISPAFFHSTNCRINSISPMYFSPFEEERKWKKQKKKFNWHFSHLHSPCHSQRSLTLNETEQRKGKFRFCRRLGCGENNPSGGMIGAQNLFIENAKLLYLEAPQMWLLRWVKWVKMFLL